MSRKLFETIINKGKEHFNAAIMIANEFNIGSIKSIWREIVIDTNVDNQFGEDNVVFKIDAFNNKYQLVVFSDMAFGIIANVKESRRKTLKSEIADKIHIIPFGEELNNVALGNELGDWDWFWDGRGEENALWIKANLLLNGDFRDNMKNLAKEINEQITKQMKTE